LNSSSDSTTAVQIFDDAKDVAPHKLQSTTNEPQLQAILDALPLYFLRSGLTKEEHADCKEALETVDTVKALIRQMLGVVRTRHRNAINRLLRRLDNDHFDRRWICKTCGYRWGLHDEDTMECPESEIDPSEM
jgi:rubrerythrin